ncbi:VOC family protein [Kribbella sp. GL6]|uniref:VOC family protein n=1 Tax=Kribbella sp. GL6 TaxID=3419765 RepID=UPI003CFF39CB
MTNNDTLWRLNPDSSELQHPRTFIRVFVAPGELSSTVTFYETLLQVKADMRMPYPARGLSLAAVGGFLIIEGDDDALEPFRRTVGTQLVHDADVYFERLLALGAEVVHQPIDVPVGRGFTVRHPDGTIVEYVHHR